MGATQKGEREEALEKAQCIVDNYKVTGFAYDAGVLYFCNALLSFSKAEGEIERLALGLVQALNRHSVGAALHGQAYTDVVGAKNLLAAALSPKEDAAS